MAEGLGTLAALNGQGHELYIFHILLKIQGLDDPVKRSTLYSAFYNADCAKAALQY